MSLALGRIDMTDEAYAVPLHELLARVPRSARLEIIDPDGMGTRFIPVGRYCHEAAEALRARLAQPEPEPVAQVQVAEDYHAHVIWTEGVNPVDLDQKFLYTAPPQREWQGLTDEEREEATGWSVEHIEAKLKEKNHG